MQLLFYKKYLLLHDKQFVAVLTQVLHTSQAKQVPDVK